LYIVKEEAGRKRMNRTSEREKEGEGKKEERRGGEKIFSFSPLRIVDKGRKKRKKERGGETFRLSPLSPMPCFRHRPNAMARKKKGRKKEGKRRKKKKKEFYILLLLFSAALFSFAAGRERTE